MSLIEFGLTVLVAAVCGLLGQFLTGYSRGGCPMAFLAGFAGAFAGPWAAARLEWQEPFILPVGPVEYPLITSAAGALVLVVLANLATRKRKF